jgi:hypothetical protein
MANYVIVDPFIGAPGPVSLTATVQQFPLGLVVRAVDQNTGTANVGGGEFIYCVGAGTGGTAGAFVQYAGYTASVMSAANSASRLPCGFAAGALTATNAYGWVQIRGIVENAKATNADIAAGVPMYLHAGAGQVASAVVAGNQVQGLFAYKSVGSALASVGSASFQIEYPQVMGLSASL